MLGRPRGAKHQSVVSQQRGHIARIRLADALAIVLLMADAADSALDPAATRWLGRLAVERPTVRLKDLRLALAALEVLPHRPRDARSILAGLCERHGLESVVGLDRDVD
jgi:hypothetical protein